MSDLGASFPEAPVSSQPTGNPPATESSLATAMFARSSERLVRQLFDVGIELHELRDIFDRRDSTEAQVLAASVAVSDVIEDLDELIHDTSRAMLALARDRFVMTELQIRGPVLRKHRH
ncbi:hypothetical protein [Nocardia sp. NPDC006630]|uniref:hypothetical protein n=1 Tax=Nocardia sp. NPDC006630 TaxID=3157181 RepID=UPI0033B8FCA8